jgi:hypothetical protein
VKLDFSEGTSWAMCNVHITFNGVEITHICTEADDLKGYAKVIISTNLTLSERGLHLTQMVPDQNGEPLIQTINGKVEITLKPDAPEAARLEFERRRQQEI